MLHGHKVTKANNKGCGRVAIDYVKVRNVVKEARPDQDEGRCICDVGDMHHYSESTSHESFLESTLHICPLAIFNRVLRESDVWIGENFRTPFASSPNLQQNTSTIIRALTNADHQQSHLPSSFLVKTADQRQP